MLFAITLLICLVAVVTQFESTTNLTLINLENSSKKWVILASPRKYFKIIFFSSTITETFSFEDIEDTGKNETIGKGLFFIVITPNPCPGNLKMDRRGKCRKVARLK